MSERENGHRATVGVTRSGKTTFCQCLASGLRSRGRFVGIFDPRSPGGKDWDCDLWTADPFALLHWAKTHTSIDVGKQIYLFWDEWGPYVGRSSRKAEPFKWLGSTSRHQGQTQTVIAHRWQDIDTGLRENIDVAWCFCSGRKSAVMLAEDFNAPELEELLPKKPRYLFEEVTRWADRRSGQIKLIHGKPRISLRESGRAAVTAGARGSV